MPWILIESHLKLKTILLGAQKDSKFKYLT